MTNTHSDHVSSSPDSSTVLRSPLDPACQPPSNRHRTSPLQTTDLSVFTRPVVDVLAWLTRATLDVIGEAGNILNNRFAFLYSFSVRIWLLFSFTSTSWYRPLQHPYARERARTSLCNRLLHLANIQCVVRLTGLVPFPAAIRVSSV
jgi:hypothetical protein